MSAESLGPRDRFGSWRRSFRTWRGQRPFWAGLLTLLGGLPIMYFPYANLTVGQLTIRMATTAGSGSLIIGVLLVVPIFVHVAVETTGTMLLGSEIGAALAAIEPLGVDYIGLNCSTGPAEMSEHLRYLSRHARIGVSVMPNAGLPELGPNGAVYNLSPEELAEALTGFVSEFGLGMVGGCCGTTPEHLRQVVEAMTVLRKPERHPVHEASVSSLYQPASTQKYSLPARAAAAMTGSSLSSVGSARSEFMKSLNTTGRRTSSSLGRRMRRRCSVSGAKTSVRPPSTAATETGTVSNASPGRRVSCQWCS